MDERRPDGDEETLDLDAGEFVRAIDEEEGSEASLAAGAGDLGAGGDVAGDFAGFDPEGDEGKAA